MNNFSGIMQSEFPEIYHIINIFDQPVYYINENKSAISTPAAATTSPSASEKNNLKKVTVILEEGSSPSEPELLSKMIRAVRLDMDKIEIKGIADIENPAAFADSHKPDVMLLFTSIHLGFEPYQIIKMDDTTIIAADSLSSLQKNDTGKKKLWALLQQIFPEAGNKHD